MTAPKKVAKKVASKGKSSAVVKKSHAVVKAPIHNEDEIYFNEVIGQPRAKKQLGFYLDRHIKNGSPVPHLLLLGSKGDGKTHLAKKFAKNLPDTKDPTRTNKAFFAFNGSAIGSVTMLLEDVLSKLQDTYCTVFIDEAHGLPPKVQTSLLTILEPNASNRTTYTFNDVQYEFDFRKITFVFATTEDDKIFHALKDRLQCLVLEPYSAKELAEIIKLIVGSKVSFEKGLLEEISGYVRRNARDADRMAKNVLSFGTSLFERGHFEILKDKLNLFPYGITHDEIRALKILQSDGECALGHLASRLAQPAKAVQKSLEPYLIATGLMEIDGKRRITGLGRTFLKGIGEGEACSAKLP